VGVHIIATGGTIASLADPRTGAVTAAVPIEELVRAVPGLDAVGDVSREEIARINGWNVTPQIMCEVSAALNRALARDDVDGAVVTHGTDTVEETAFLCDVTLHSDKPVAFAAAMRSGSELGADGPRNLLHAALVASSGEARGIGAVLVLNDEIHAARWVRKRDSFRASAFTSPEHGPIGFVVDGTARIHWAPRPVAPVGRPAALDMAVPVVSTYTGMDENLIPAILATTGASGLVVDGTGLGNVPGSAVSGIARAIESGLPVVVATRAPTGGTRAVYGGPGGGVTLRDLGALPAGGLSAAKARLLLMVLLAEGLAGDALRRTWSQAVSARA